VTIGEYIRQTDIDAYNRLMSMFKVKEPKKKEKINLGDSITNLMKSDSYCRQGRRIKQRGWS
jgi:hypothetical protein